MKRATRLSARRTLAAHGSRVAGRSAHRTRRSALRLLRPTGLGELVTVRDHESLAISNTMDAVGSLLKVVRDGGRGIIEASMVYDDMGRKIQSNDPDAGSWKTVYNAAGEVIEQIALHAGQSQRIRQRYDARGRVFVKTVDNAQGALESTTTMV